MSDETCVFCDIAANKMPAFRIYEDERTVAFADINPATPGHTLVIPKQHYASIMDLTPGDVAAVHQTVQRVARAMRASLKPGGILIAQLNGAAAGQVVMHYHVHLIPRNPGDALAAMSWQMLPGDMAQIEKMALRIASGL